MLMNSSSGAVVVVVVVVVMWERSVGEIESTGTPVHEGFPFRPMSSMAKYMIGRGLRCIPASLRSPPAHIWWCCQAWERAT
ncbi:hypothetical protein DEU56DRAFT_790145, partial [Suillus clintonianus]|uniref:uncharacterized protein n=1 Tax=Suillus clintonianus TaxID=1904413 RepID=UPI001B8829A0